MEQHASYIDGKDILRLPSDDSQGDQVIFYQTGYKSNGILFSDTIGFGDFLRRPDVPVPKQKNCILKEDCL